MNPSAPEFHVARDFAVAQKLAVLATVSPLGDPEAALMGVAVTPELEIVFDTFRANRKYANLKAHPRVAAVIGYGAVSIQYEGIAEELKPDPEEHFLKLYYEAFPGGAQRHDLPGMTYFVIHPRWLRYCDYTQRPPVIREFQF